MLEWLRGREAAHPLEGRDDAKLLLSSLSGKGPFAALEELAAYLDEVKTAQSLKPARAFEIVELLDRSARPLVRKLTSEYVSSHHRLTRFQQHRIWFSCRSLLEQLAEGYQTCLARYQAGAVGAAVLKPALPRIAGRALRAYGGVVKWTLLHYGEVEADVWLQMVRLYAIGEALECNQTLLHMYRGERQESCPAREFLRPLMLYVSAPHALLPIQVEVVDRLTAAWSDAFVIGRKTGECLHYVIEADKGEPPVRCAFRRGAGTQSLFFGAGEAMTRASRYANRLQRYGQVPAEPNLGLDVSPQILLGTLDHLQRHWGPMQPERRQPRTRVDQQLKVVHDYDEVAANAGALFLESPFVSNDESWTIEEQSANGCGLLVPKGRGEWLRVGTLLGLRRDGATTWSVGVVRRIAKRKHGERHVGVQRLGDGGCVVTLFPLARSGRSKLSSEGEVAVLLAGAAKNADEAALLLRPDVFNLKGAIEMRAYDRSWVLQPVRVLEGGEDFEIGIYRLQAGE